MSNPTVCIVGAGTACCVACAGAASGGGGGLAFLTGILMILGAHGSAASAPIRQPQSVAYQVPANANMAMPDPSPPVPETASTAISEADGPLDNTPQYVGAEANNGDMHPTRIEDQPRPDAADINRSLRDGSF